MLFWCHTYPQSIHGKDISSVPLHHLRAQLRIVSQESHAPTQYKQRRWPDFKQSLEAPSTQA
jgi:hypothetical protein